MSIVHRLTRFIARGGERGSALLVSLMVLVGLSLIGLGYVALSETESAIAANERNAAQTLHIAEAGGLMVIEWFQNPKWALDQGLAPANTDAIKVVRKITTEPPANTLIYTGRYKEATGAILFDKPYKKSNDDRFFGTESNPDILINDRTAPDFLAAFNVALFNNDPDATPNDNCDGCDNRQGGRVIDIRVYAPPIDGGHVNTEVGWGTPATSGIQVGSGFHYRGTRFGLATIRVTAAKFNNPECGVYVTGCRVISERTTKFVIAEWPFPGPGGPIQSNANIGTTGNYHIHWGKITASQEIDLKRPYVSIPWQDAYHQTVFERGYEAAATPVNQKVWPTDTSSGSYLNNHDWFYELIGRSYEDPWYQARARGRIIQMASTTDPHELRYRDKTANPSGPVCNPCNAGKAAAPGQSNLFQLQTKSVNYDYRNTLFPRVDYDFWKQVAISADTQDNIYYLQWVSKDNFRDRHGNVRSFRNWVDVRNTAAVPGGKSKPGFYFFDTENRLNPQNNRGGVLTDKVSMSGGNMQMQGFIYLNSEEVDITGLGGYPGYYNMPGEVYRDVGYRKVDQTPGPNYKQWAKLDPAGPACTPADTSNCVMIGAGNNEWDYQPLEFSNGGTSDNGEFDVFVAQTTRTRSSTPAALVEYFPVTYYPGCNPGKNGVGSSDCSEPHEPYLNFIYPPTNGATNAITVRWELPNLQTRRRKTNPNAVAPPTALPACTSASSQEDCTSNAYDRDGALVELSPILDGVLYNEGEFGSAGNAHYFGSLLFERDVEASGTPNIWFDEKLVKGLWPPGNFGFPRVYITTYETDQ